MRYGINEVQSGRAHELKLELTESWGIAKFLQAREYRRVATHVLRFSKASHSPHRTTTYFLLLSQNKTDTSQILWQRYGEFTADGPEHYTKVSLSASHGDYFPLLSSQTKTDTAVIDLVIGQA